MWLFGFSTFFFLNLALVKRSTELYAKIKSGSEATMSRGYQVSDHPQLSALGTASGFMSIIVLALYINSDAVATLYANPEFLWGLCPVLMYWISRFWLLTSRGVMSHDPVAFAIKDRPSYVMGAVAVVLWFLARGF